jgi:hypothetical protein
MPSPGPLRRPPLRRRPRPFNFRPHSAFFSTAALRPCRGAVRLLAASFTLSWVMFQLDNYCRESIVAWASTRGSAPAGHPLLSGPPLARNVRGVISWDGYGTASRRRFSSPWHCSVGVAVAHLQALLLRLPPPPISPSTSHRIRFPSYRMPQVLPSM